MMERGHSLDAEEGGLATADFGFRRERLISILGRAEHIAKTAS